MKQKLDLFRLHSEDDGPNGWIWAELDSDLLRSEYLKLLGDKSQKQIGREIKSKLKCGESTVTKHLIKLKKSRKRTELPLCIICELTRIIGLDSSLINEQINYLLCKTDTTGKRVKAVKNLNTTLCKILGAHIADGYMTKEYRIKLSDGRIDNIEVFTQWLRDTFGINTIIRKEEDNTINCFYNNKVIGRYFEKIFSISTGNKTYIAREPEMIKNSSIRLREAFLLGVMTFDGGISSSGIVGISSMSKKLVYDRSSILETINEKHNIRYNTKKGSLERESKSGRNTQSLRKWTKLFEKGTWKYERINFFLSDKEYSIDKIRNLFPKHHRGKIWVNDLWLALNNFKEGKIENLQLEFNKMNKRVANTTIYKYLFILEKSGLIRKEGIKNTNGKNWWSETKYIMK